jgi:hypothetical protein
MYGISPFASQLLVRDSTVCDMANQKKQEAQSQADLNTALTCPRL